MAVGFRAGTGAASNSAVTSFTVSFPAGAAAGDMVWLHIESVNANVSYGTPTGWTKAAEHSNFLNTNLCGAIYYRVLVAGDTAPTVTFADGAGQGGAAAYSCVAFTPTGGGTLAVDNVADAGRFSAAGTSLTVDSRIAAASSVASVIFAGARSNTTSQTALSQSPPTGWTEPAGVDRSTTMLGGVSGTEQIATVIFYRLQQSGTVAPGNYTVSRDSSSSAWHYLIKEVGSGPATQTADATAAVTAAGVVDGTVAGVSGAQMPLGRNAAGLRGVNQLLLRIGRGVAARSVSVPLPVDAQLTWTVPGGDDTLTCTIPWPDRGIARPDAFTHNMPVRVEDRRTGTIIWQGRVADPGYSGDRANQEFRLSAVGSVRDLDMIAVLKLYMDRDLSHWTDQHFWPSGDLNTQENINFTASANDALGVSPEGMLEFPLPQGSTLNSGAQARMVYKAGWNAGNDLSALGSDARSTGPTAVVPEIHGLRFSMRQNAATANNVIEVLTGSALNGTSVVTYSATWPGDTQVDVSLREGLTGGWTRTDVKTLWMQWRRSGATTTQSSDGWARWANIQVIGKRYDRYSTDVTASSGVEAISPYEIVEDLLGTTLNGRVDPGTIIPDTAVLVDQAVWWGATPVSQILAAAAGFNPDAWWGVWAAASKDGNPRLDYRTWNTTPRYTLDDSARVELAGGAEDWPNSALVSFTRQDGTVSTTRATINVPALTRIFGTSGSGVTAANTRDLDLDLTARPATTKTQAQALATAMLWEAATEKASGSAVVRSPMMDGTTGRLVQPWEVRPGWPVLVGATPNQFTSGAPVAYDGESTFRLTKVTYSASDDSATLELDGGIRRLAKSGHGAAPRYVYLPQAARPHHRAQR